MFACDIDRSPRQLRIGDAGEAAAGGQRDAEYEAAAAVAVDGLQRAFAPDRAAMGVGADQADILRQQAEGKSGSTAK